MSNTKHTPGPWKIGTVGDATEHTASITSEDGKTFIGMVEMHSFEDDETTTPEQEANAVLIASAPDTLDTIRAILEWTECRDGDARTDENIIGTIGQMARAAIAKATGG